ncbi:MAG: TolC family protein [Bacteroidaceae bacterium]|nr:TolC family protein [Bacteroidaceae bacterium]MBO4841248.1 TolC family protein [Bacteroidaceae bacterium]
MNTYKALITAVFFSASSLCYSQNLQEMITIAKNQSLDASYIKHKRVNAELAYKYYRANLLPEIKLTSIPMRYSSDVVERYSYDDDRTVYRAQQSLYSATNVMLKQDVGFLGGYVYMESDLRYYRTLQNETSQFTSVPLRVGYNQNIVGFNPYKWNRKLEKLNLSLSQKETVSGLEEIAIETINRYFSIVILSEQRKQARMKFLTCDSLYQTGVYRSMLGGISNSDLYELKIERNRSESEIIELDSKIESEKLSFAKFLQLTDTTLFHFEVPTNVRDIDVPLDKAQNLALENSSLILNCKRSKIQNEQAEAQAKTQRFLEASLSVNVGWHQVADNFRGVYKGLLNEQSALINVSIPLADFGRRKAQLSQIRENIELDIINEKKAADNVTDEILSRVSYMTINQRKVRSCAETYELSQMFYKEALESYKLGRNPFSKVCEALIQQKIALADYYNAMRDYWVNYYEIRRMTLYDFEKGCPLSPK